MNMKDARKVDAICDGDGVVSVGDAFGLCILS